MGVGIGQGVCAYGPLAGSPVALRAAQKSVKWRLGGSTRGSTAQPLFWCVAMDIGHLGRTGKDGGSSSWCSITQRALCFTCQLHV